MSDDAALVAASQTGDVAAFGQLIERYHNLVCAIAYSRTGDRVASEDIAQDTFLAAWAGLAGLRDADKLRSWLCGIARNLASKSVRGRRHEVDVADHEGELAGDAGPLDAMLTKELETTVWAALQQLPETYREPLVLFYREQQSIKDVALGLGLSEDTAKQRLSRGRQALKDNMGALVEQTLQAGRPRKAAAAAVIALIMAAHGSKTALAASLATHATTTPSTTTPPTITLHPTGRTSRGLVAVAGVAVCAAVAVGGAVMAHRVHRSASTSHVSSTTLAALRQAQQAWNASTGGIRTCEMHGSVSGVDGAAVPNALVAIIEHSWQASALEPTLVETDARGQWRATLPVGAYTISVSAPGQRARTQVASCELTHSNDVAFALGAGGVPLRGTITDVGSGPVAGAMVWLLDPNRASSVFVTRTDATGAYELRVDRGLYLVLATHPEYALDVRPVTLGDRGAREDMALLPGASVDGIVVDPSGAPVAGAKVNTVAPIIQLHDDAPARWKLAASYAALLPATSDGSGRFRLRGLPPGTTRLTAHTGAFAAATPASVDLTMGQAATDAKIVMTNARAISGFVVARDDEKHGIAGVQMIAISDAAPVGMPIVTTTDGAGFYELAGLAPGSYRLTAVGGGFAPYVADESLTLGDVDVHDRIITLDRGVTVRGHAEPATAALGLKLQPVRGTKSPVAYIKAAMTRADIDEQGNFTFQGVAPGDYVLVATAFDRTGELPIHVGQVDQTAVRLPLDARPAITGTVTDPNGHPLGGLLVAALPARPQDPFAALHTTVRTGDDGAFTIIGVTPGDYDLRVFDGKGQRPWAAQKRPYRARSVEVPSTGTVTETLQVATGGARVTGLAVGTDQQPIADAWIEVRDRAAARRPEMFPAPPILTGADGRFVIDGVFGSELVVDASSPDGSHHATAIAAPGAQVKLELAPMTTLTAKVTSGGQSVSVFELTLKNTQTEVVRHARGAAGQVSLSVVAGEHELSVTSTAGYAKQTITVGRQPAANVELALLPWGSVHGRALGSDGRPWADAVVFVHDRLEPSIERTDADGQFSLAHVIAGSNELSIIQDMQFVRVTFDVTPGQSLDLGTLKAGSWGIGVTARSASGSPAGSKSADLGLQMFVSVAPPTPAELAALAADPLAASRNGQDPNAGLWIASVEPGSVAARVGLRAGDRITGVGMSPVTGGQGAVEMMSSLSQPWRSRGRTVPWTIVRGGHELVIAVLVPN